MVLPLRQMVQALRLMVLSPPLMVQAKRTLLFRLAPIFLLLFVFLRSLRVSPKVIGGAIKCLTKKNSSLEQVLVANIQ